MVSTRPFLPRLLVAAGLGTAAVAGGVLVLRLPGATDVGGPWFSYGPRPTPDVIDRLTGWNPTREVGAGLVVVGLLVLAAALGVGWGRRRGYRPGRRTLVAAAAVSAALVLVGVVAFVYPRSNPASHPGTSVLIHGPGPVGPLPPVASMVWSRGQVMAAAATTVGLLVGSWLVGLVSGRRHAVST